MIDEILEEIDKKINNTNPKCIEGYTRLQDLLDLKRKILTVEENNAEKGEIQ